MNPTYALVIIATVMAARPFFEVPDAKAKAEAQKRGGYRPNAKTGCFYVLLLVPLMGLWWWYALATDQVMLGVIPTIGLVATSIAQMVEQAALKSAGSR